MEDTQIIEKSTKHKLVAVSVETLTELKRIKKEGRYKTMDAVIKKYIIPQIP